MGKNTRPLSGQSQRKFFRTLFQSDPGVSAEASARLTEICATEIAQIRVRLPLVGRRPKAAASPSVPDAVRTRPDPEPDPPASFDPHAFSLIVIMRKGGADALMAQLSHVADLAHLRAIASAQHVSIDHGIEDRSALLAAIVEGTGRRIAHRQAAAS